MIIGGILALAFMGFTGVDSGIRKAITPAPAEDTAAVMILEHDAIHPWDARGIVKEMRMS